jgi:Mpv17 / PMP22 family
MAPSASSPEEATPLLTSSLINNHANGINRPQESDVGGVGGGFGRQSANTATSSDDVSPSRSAASWWAAYIDAVESHPLLTKSITAAVILGAADLTAQFVEYIRGEGALEGNAAPDWPRTLRFAVMGLIGAPWSHYYFYWLDRYYPPTVEPWTKVTALKVCVDQFIQAPLLLAIMIAALSLMKGLGLIGVKHDLQHTFLDALIANCKDDSFCLVSALALFALTMNSLLHSTGKLWIPASILNLAFVQPSLRVLFVNVVFFFWTIILSILLNQAA